MKIFYGLNNHLLDVTNICFSKLLNNDIITIPSCDVVRTSHFTDPLKGVLKKIYVLNNGITTEYDEQMVVQIRLSYNFNIITVDDINNKLSNIQSKLKIIHGTFNEELPEQKMVTRYLTGNEKVLEIGSNIGRNSLIIASILQTKNNSSFVTLESDYEIAKQLCENRDLNGFSFYIENSALTKRQLIQQGWNTIESDVLLDGYTLVKTITLEHLYQKYKINFDTLVLDCEGAFFNILIDMPEILNNLNLIIMENDYDTIEKKEHIDAILRENSFYLDYSECGGSGPCSDNFFEVWKR
jgi:FkbM family methyltransferase